MATKSAWERSYPDLYWEVELLPCVRWCVVQSEPIGYRAESHVIGTHLKAPSRGTPEVLRSQVDSRSRVFTVLSRRVRA